MDNILRSRVQLVETLFVLLIKVKESLYITIGHLPIGDPRFPKLRELIETMLQESKVKCIYLKL